MKVLLVCSYKEHLAEHAAPFVVEQMKALQRCGVECDLFLVKGKGIGGYLKQFRPLKKRISAFQPDVIHAHYGLCGLLSGLQRKVPVITTYHGSDINDKKARPFSKMAMRLSKWNIFVSKKTLEMAGEKSKYSLLPCGVDLSALQLTSKAEARQRMGLNPEKRYVLFAGAFSNTVKNAPLAKEAVRLLHDGNADLMELKGYSRDEVTLLLCAADVFLMTSLSEGSPQVIKEAMACGCPIVSVDVGDVKERMDGLEGCFLADSFEPQTLADLLQKAFALKGRTKGREKVVADALDNEAVANQLVALYHKIS